jgi:Protein of unknown function (DUF1091)
VKLFVKKDKDFRQVFRIPPIEWCSLVDGNTSNPLVKAFTKNIKDYAPHFIHPCPYVGRYELKGVRGVKEVLAILPKGILKSVSKMIDGDKVRTMTFTCIMEVL